MMSMSTVRRAGTGPVVGTRTVRPESPLAIVVVVAVDRLAAPLVHAQVQTEATARKQRPRGHPVVPHAADDHALRICAPNETVSSGDTPDAAVRFGARRMNGRVGPCSVRGVDQLLARPRVHDGIGGTEGADPLQG